MSERPHIKPCTGEGIASVGPTGRLLYVMGASGAGKDSVIRVAMKNWGDPEFCRVATRYITRQMESSWETHVPLKPGEFAEMEAEGKFALAWRANGHGYGIGREIDHWLQRGLHVVVNGSREYLPQAGVRYSQQLLPILIDVTPAVIRQRLTSRGREAPEEIEMRIRRHQRLVATLPASAIRIENNGSLDEAASRFGQILERLRTDGNLLQGL